ncbi:hypothetical protein IWQ56_005033, partial [Coemansia nantahalensis]
SGPGRDPDPNGGPPNSAWPAVLALERPWRVLARADQEQLPLVRPVADLRPRQALPPAAADQAGQHRSGRWCQTWPPQRSPPSPQPTHQPRQQPGRGRICRRAAQRPPRVPKHQSGCGRPGGSLEPLVGLPPGRRQLQQLAIEHVGCWGLWRVAHRVAAAPEEQPKQQV